MANSKKRRKTLVFTGIGLILVALTGVAMFKKRDIVVVVQTEKVARHNLTELVLGFLQLPHPSHGHPLSSLSRL